MSTDGTIGAPDLEKPFMGLGGWVGCFPPSLLSFSFLCWESSSAGGEKRAGYKAEVIGCCPLIFSFSVIM